MQASLGMVAGLELQLASVAALRPAMRGLGALREPMERVAALEEPMSRLAALGGIFDRPMLLAGLALGGLAAWGAVTFLGRPAGHHQRGTQPGRGEGELAVEVAAAVDFAQARR